MIIVMMLRLIRLFHINNSLFLSRIILVDEKIFTCHGGLSPDLASMEQIRRIMRPTDVPDQGLLCDLLWSDPDKDTMGWGENDRGVSFTFGPEVSFPTGTKHIDPFAFHLRKLYEQFFFESKCLMTKSF